VAFTGFHLFHCRVFVLMGDDRGFASVDMYIHYHYVPKPVQTGVVIFVWKEQSAAHLYRLTSLSKHSVTGRIN